jgi:hypothetical protein
VTNAQNYLRIEGIEPNQTSQNVFKRILIWMSAITSGELPIQTTEPDFLKDIERFRFIRPKLIHLFPQKTFKDNTIQSSKNNLCLVTFASVDELDLVHKVFRRFNRLIEDQNRQPFTIGLAYDTRSAQKAENWVGCTLRNIPSGFGQSQIIAQLERNKKFGILKCSPVHSINEKNCGILTLKSIEDAERLIVEWNGVKASEGNYLKLSVHPWSSRKRPTDLKSTNPLFNDLQIVSDDSEKKESDLAGSMNILLQMKV